MKVYEVLIEYTSLKLDRLFSYVYHSEIKLLSRVIVNFKNKDIVGIVLNVKDIDLSLQEYTKVTGYELKQIKEVIDQEPLINEELKNICFDIAKMTFAPKISVLFALLPPSLKPSLTSLNKPQICYQKYVRVIPDFDYNNLTTKQAELLYKISKQDLKKSECSSTILSSLIKKNKVEIYQKEINRMIHDKVDKTDFFLLNEDQKNAYEQIISSSDKIYLLEGVTGSGKTEVYLHLVREMIKLKKSVIVLVPEISLSYHMVESFLRRFDNVAILHSKLTNAQRYDEYRRIKNNEVDIVIGTRSAIFAPLDNIGLVIIDEEHSETYKQDDSLPYYHCLDVAKIRQQYQDFKIVLGSATPSLESKSRALKGVYKQLYLPHRVNELNLPEVQIVEMNNYQNITRESSLLSKVLIDEIQDRLNNKEQVMLIVNRRGYSPYVSCRKCGHVIKCPECQIALTYHYSSQKLICHHCSFQTNMIHTCPKCKSDKVFLGGFGTEKVELEVKRIFTNARVGRLDSDIAKARLATKDVISKFQRQELDILVGTQMISKGHDFSNVTLVGVVLADLGLTLPSYKANEKTFSLLTQAIGRSGRRKLGKAIIQTYNKNNFVIRTASNQDYTSFYQTEIKYRKMLANPPFTYIAMLIISSKDQESLEYIIDEVKRYIISEDKTNQLIVVGPSEMFIKKNKDMYRKKLIVKYKDISIVTPILNNLISYFTKNDSSSISININPYEDY